MEPLESPLIGWNPFARVDHFDRERVRERDASLTLARMAAVIAAAVSSGARGFTFTAGIHANSLLHYLDHSGFQGRLAMYPLLPDTEAIPKLLSLGTRGMVTEMLRDLSGVGKMRAIFKGGWAAATSNPIGALDTYVKVEIEKLARTAPRSCYVRSVLLHETITDCIVGLQAAEPMLAFHRIVSSMRGLSPGFQTRNLPATLEFVRQIGIDLRDVVIMTPANPIGFQMAPTKLACERSLRENTGLHAIAISVLGAGQVEPREALAYLNTLKGVESVAAGVSSPRHAADTFSTLSELHS